jgi:hypothetical protein
MVIVTRIHPKGTVTCADFCIDKLCRGLIGTRYFFNVSPRKLAEIVEYYSDKENDRMFLHGRKITRYLQPVFCKQIMHTIQAPLIFNERNVVIIFFQKTGWRYLVIFLPCRNILAETSSSE